ncbi:PQQ-dependent sugar dehydrogenase [Chryseobacterium chendengshani]|uniref:PQQ-dependent sugar dehydrogenase n=1 Tax=Chryseobacterium sp. LJ668 TaxID=2864040 RepID=UPI001C6921D1|nr:PQQ-dependent sugar dehydrogenase [Chryseobacterium sp. LJ668]MBW8523741.1 PQQ-dependent sugar dehydrogenase [Chryseobacterium sp. LJ668]QYK16685.1 PQQ-dependent sugar dehydrogenase [Chryseobacterium sp. LJ668]
MSDNNIFKIIPLVAAFVFSNTSAQRGIPPGDVTKITHSTNYPEHLDFLPEMVNLLKVPDGWAVSIAASGLGKPRMLYHTSEGNLYITRRDTGDVLLLKDSNRDAKFEDVKTVVAEFKGVHGITLKDGWLYLCNNTELRRYRINSDGTLRDKEMLFNDMPSAGQHPNRTMDFGPDGKLYISIGTLCNDCKESDREAASMVQVDPVTWKRTIFASGLRNTIGFDWHPQTNEFWGMDNGGDAKGDDWPPEELNNIKEGKSYGFPFAYAKKEVDETREDPAGNSKEEWVKTTESSSMEYQAHMAPIGFQFFPTGTTYSGDALVNWHGSWNRSKSVGFKVQKIRFSNGKPVSAEDFLTGFLNGKTRFGRPAGIAITASGTVYISDDANGVLYSIKQK